MKSEFLKYNYFNISSKKTGHVHENQLRHSKRQLFSSEEVKNHRVSPEYYFQDVKCSKSRTLEVLRLYWILMDVKYFIVLKMLRIGLFIIHKDTEKKTGVSYLMENALLYLEIIRKLTVLHIS